MAWVRDGLRETRRCITAWRAHWLWWTLNAAALTTLVFVLTQGSSGWDGTADGFDRMLESGKWGIRWLLVSLAMTPLHTYLRWSGALKLRKPAGLWAFAFGATHFVLYAVETWEPVPAYRTNGIPWHWLAWPMPLYIALGLLALIVLTALAITSNRWAMRRLGKGWKRLHRLVYGAGVAIVAHALLASTMSKKMMVRDPHAVPELQLYLGILTVLLVIRIPQIHTLLRRVVVARPAMYNAVPAVPSVVPQRTPPQRILPLRQVPMLERGRKITATEVTATEVLPAPGAIPDAKQAAARAIGEALPDSAEATQARERETVY